MSGAQTSAFQAAAGFPPSAGEGLFIGAAMTFLLLWSAWAMDSTWRGWATNNLDTATAGVSAIRIVVLLSITSFFLLS
ncbi:TIGR03758 family integrating conjugative element protein [Pseudomonas aeruginosa]